MYTILVTGSKGQLGSEIADLKGQFSECTFFLTDKEELDITNETQIEEFVIKNNINAIINCAAYTSVDKAEDDKELAYKINYLAVKNIAEIVRKHQLKLIHVSTDYVFDGTSEVPYSETDATNPKNVYGYSKLLGEKALLEINPSNSLIIRTSWLYSSFGHNFVKTILKLSKEKAQITVVNDQIGSPTYAKDLAIVILKLILKLDTKQVEIVHYSNSGKCSWFQFAQEIINNAESECKVLPISSEAFNSKAFRPNFSLLNTEKIKKSFQIRIPNWKDSLKVCLNKMKEPI
jgi:dTDP-4-dehydrorhamnose reductase